MASKRDNVTPHLRHSTRIAFLYRYSALKKILILLEKLNSTDVGDSNMESWSSLLAADIFNWPAFRSWSTAAFIGRVKVKSLSCRSAVCFGLVSYAWLQWHLLNPKRVPFCKQLALFSKQTPTSQFRNRIWTTKSSGFWRTWTLWPQKVTEDWVCSMVSSGVSVSVLTPRMLCIQVYIRI